MNKKRHFFSVLALLGVLIGLWFMPHPATISDQAWRLFAVFATTIMGVVLQPFPMGAVVVMGISILLFTKTLSLEQGLSGFHNPIAWLVLISFSIAKGIIKTGLGERVAYFFVKVLGRTPLGIAYGLTITDFLLAPAIPSVTARSGGIIFPVVTSLANSFGSSPDKSTSQLIGSYLIKVAYQASVITSAMFLTAMAGNPLLAALSESVNISLSWSTWAIAAIVPGILSLICMPIIIRKIYPPEIKSAKCKEAAETAKRKLKEMPPLSLKEKILLFIFFALIVLWIFGDYFGINATVAAMVGLSLLLIFDILDWKDVITNSTAWETFIWFGALIMMASYLNQFGFIPALGEYSAIIVKGLSWKIGFPILFLIYFYSHYLFASNTAHIGALFPVFLVVATSMGTDPMLAVLCFAFSSCLFGGLTQYGSGPAPIFYGSGYVTVKDWWRVGFIQSLFNIFIWFVLGSLWWKVLGLI
ncbi:MAG: anion permease [Victivallaceae bacterium]